MECAIRKEMERWETAYGANFIAAGEAGGC